MHTSGKKILLSVNKLNVGRELPLHFFIIYSSGWVTDNESKLQSQKRRGIPKMRKRFKTWRWIVMQVNANPRASLAIWVWLWAAREINLRKTAADVLQSHGIHSSASHSSLPPCHTSVVIPPSAREERVSDHAQQGFSSLGIPMVRYFHTIPIPASTTAGEIQKILAGHQTPLSLSLQPLNTSELKWEKNVALLTQHQFKHQGAVKHPHCVFDAPLIALVKIFKCVATLQENDVQTLSLLSALPFCPSYACVTKCVSNVPTT